MTDNATNRTEGTLRLAAVGDLLLPCDPRGIVPDRRPEGLFDAVADIFAGCDVVLGNLECTLPGDGPCVPTEPRVVATEELVRAVGQAGFTHVTLANNHMFDCLHAGFTRTRRFVMGMGVSCFGAGDDLSDAFAPAFAEAAGIRITFLGAVDECTGVSQFADQGRWGVAPLDMDRLLPQISKLAEQVDHVVVSAHWGEERLGIPSPSQIAQAHAMVDAGASMILGHHPHVLQGLEVYRGAPIIYSLGNFVANEVYWTDGDAVTWNRTERTGCILLAELTRDSIEIVGQIPTYDDATRVTVDETSFGAKRIARVNRALSRGVTLKRYRREHLRVKTIKPILAHLKWSELRRIRWRHFRKALGTIFRAGRAE